MRVPIYIAAAAAWIPPAASAKEAVANGEYSQDDLAGNNVMCLPVAPEGETASSMAVAAGRRALQRAAGVVRERIDLVLHASIYHQGHGHCWTSASFIQRELDLTGAFAMNIDQASNGGMAAVDLAGAYLESGRADTVLVTTADRFASPGFNRWESTYGVVFGDGATALVLSSKGGFARIVAMESMTDATLEQLYRGTEPMNSMIQPGPIDLRERQRSYVAEVGLGSVLQRFSVALCAVVGRALSKSGYELRDFTKILLPSIGHVLMGLKFLKPLGISADQTMMSWGSYTGHLGAGDQIAGLARLVEKNKVVPGDRMLLIGAGGGYSVTVAVVEIDSLPEWPDASTDFELPDDIYG